ncbi:Gfo/Idh/MocA family oxidoreductase [Pseudonocardia nematodicida]|uniref:Gfo/Idh/MocA family oxidoreductase n=1 Tax=Pseudonocardia nematodicida TaxID=1206997 RepID=A0ABV1KKH7_9PSEU
MAETLRVGVVGCGMISRDHLVAWRNEPRAEVVALCDPDPARTADRGAEFGIARHYTDAARMLDAEDLDALDVITPRQTHRDLVLLAAEHGVPVLCEKPLCPTLAEAEALVAEVGGRTRVMVNENWRFRPYFRQLREWIDAGHVGTITSARMSLTRSNLLADADGSIPALRRQPFFAAEERLLVAESLIHELDTLRYLLGETRVVGAVTRRTSPDVVGEDSAAILLTTGDGLPVVVTGCMVAAGHHYREGDHLVLTGTRSSVTLDRSVLTITGAHGKTVEYDEATARQDSFDHSVRHFVDRVRDGGEFDTSMADQLATLALVEDVYRRAG